MKKYILLLLFTIVGFAQTPSLPITNVNNLKITSPVIGTKADSVLVWNGSDKIVRRVPRSSFGGGDYIPLSGTITGKPVTGDIRLENGGFIANGSAAVKGALLESVNI